jgi:hypothetical protein
MAPSPRAAAYLRTTWAPARRLRQEIPRDAPPQSVVVSLDLFANVLSRAGMLI